jgi:hypothetical protein
MVYLSNRHHSLPKFLEETTFPLLMFKVVNFMAGHVEKGNMLSTCNCWDLLCLPPNLCAASCKHRLALRNSALSAEDCPGLG